MSYSFGTYVAIQVFFPLWNNLFVTDYVAVNTHLLFIPDHVQQLKHGKMQILKPVAMLCSCPVQPSFVHPFSRTCTPKLFRIFPII